MIYYEFIDKNIRKMVMTLNTLPGIKTIGSCGGHKNPNDIQHKEGTWFVSFYVLKEGKVVYRVLKNYFKNDKNIDFSIHPDSTLASKIIYPGRTWGAISGKNNNPDKVAKKIMDLFKE